MTIQLLRSQTGKVFVESHRGAYRLAPENSWTAIELGYESGADFVEIDVQMTADRELVIYHHYRAPDGQWIRTMRRDEVALVCAGQNHLVGLEDIFDWAARNDSKFTLDLKNGFDLQYELFARALALVEQYDLIERTVFAAWDHTGLRRLKEQNPTVTTRALLRGRPLGLGPMLQACGADAVSLSYDLASADDIRVLHEQSIAVVIAGLFEPDFARVVALGADGVSWGDPLQAIRELRALGVRGG